jgi:hypothetical protein
LYRSSGSNVWHFYEETQYLYTTNDFDLSRDGGAMAEQFYTLDSIKIWKWHLNSGAVVDASITWIVSNGGNILRTGAFVMNSDSSGANCLVFDQTDSAAWAISLYFSDTTNVALKKLTGVSDATEISGRSVWDGSEWVFSSYASIIGP